MVEKIGKIREKIARLLVRISELEGELLEEKSAHAQTRQGAAFALVEWLDQCEALLREQPDQPLVSRRAKVLREQMEALGVHPLVAPLDTLADFTEVVGTVSDPKRRNGLVAEVVKKGYLLHDELLRPTHIIVIQN